MGYRFRLSSKAARELEREIAYSAERWGKSHAIKYRIGIYATIKAITENPFSYREYHEIGEGYRLAHYKGNRIIYRVNENENYLEIIGFPSIYKSF